MPAPEIPPLSLVPTPASSSALPLEGLLNALVHALEDLVGQAGEPRTKHGLLLVHVQEQRHPVLLGLLLLELLQVLELRDLEELLLLHLMLCILPAALLSTTSNPVALASAPALAPLLLAPKNLLLPLAPLLLAIVASP